MPTDEGHEVVTMRIIGARQQRTLKVVNMVERTLFSEKA